jgi:hypothetical protein
MKSGSDSAEVTSLAPLRLRVKAHARELVTPGFHPELSTGKPSGLVKQPVIHAPPLFPEKPNGLKRPR